MKRTIQLALQCALVFLGISGAAQAASLTRSVSVVEGALTNHYLGTQFGQTLYTFDYDSNGHSACSQECAEKWPPLLVTAEQAATLAAPYATIPRANGLLQVTFHEKPLYTYFVDHAEGDDNGDGVGGVWHDVDFE